MDVHPTHYECALLVRKKTTWRRRKKKVEKPMTEKGKREKDKIKLAAMEWIDLHPLQQAKKAPSPQVFARWLIASRL